MTSGHNFARNGPSLSILPKGLQNLSAALHTAKPENYIYIIVARTYVTVLTARKDSHLNEIMFANTHKNNSGNVEINAIPSKFIERTETKM